MLEHLLEDGIHTALRNRLMRLSFLAYDLDPCRYLVASRVIPAQAFYLDGPNIGYEMCSVSKFQVRDQMLELPVPKELYRQKVL